MDRFMPHGHCFFWDEWVLIPELIGNGLTALAYFTIPFILVKIAMKRPDMTVELKGFFILFSMFIGFCGVGHVIKVFNIWHAEYMLEAIVDFFTGIISIITATYLMVARQVFGWVPKKDAYEQLLRDSEELRRIKKVESTERLSKAFKAFEREINKE